MSISIFYGVENWLWLVYAVCTKAHFRYTTVLHY
jgi:hypothetical protein